MAKLPLRGSSGLSSEHGFTIIELFLVVFLIAVLSALGLSAFYVWKDNAEYARAQDTMHQALTALQLGIMEAPDGFEVPNISNALSGTDGSDLSGNLAIMFPGASVPSGVQLGAVWLGCPTPNVTRHVVVAIPCKVAQKPRVVLWQKLCDGTVLWLDNVSSYGGPGCQSA